MADKIYYSIAKLNGSNYQVWKYKLELLLMKENLWDIVIKEKPQNASQDWIIKDGKARATIGLLVEDNQLIHVKKQTTAKDSWEALQKYHQKSTLSNKVILLKKLCNLKLKEDGNMELHINSMEDIIDQLTALGEELAERLTVALLLSSLPESYGILITALETRPEEDLTRDLVKNKLFEEFTRRRELTSSIQDCESALKASCSSNNHPDQFKQKGKCFFCKKKGHIKKDCYKYLNWKQKNIQQKVNKIGQIEHLDQIEYDTCFGIFGNRISNKWYIDSGATTHMCSDKEFFTTFNSELKQKVFLADGQTIISEGIGEGYLYCINKNTKTKILVTDVMYIPTLKGNLLSVHKLTSTGLMVYFESTGCTIRNKERILATAKNRDNLFELDIVNEAKLITCQENSECIHMWHRRLGHRDPEAIKKLVNLQLATGIRLKECNKKQCCECCIQGKMSKLPFPKKSESKSLEILDLIHTDVCGPMQTVTPGACFLKVIVGHYSNYSIDYFYNCK